MVMKRKMTMKADPPSKRQKKEEPKPMKKAPVEKKVVVDPVQEKISLIENNIETLCKEPRVTDLVIKLVKPCLSEVIESRHELQTRCISHVEECLTTIESDLKAATAEHETVIVTADEVKAANTKKREEVIAAIEAKEAAISGFETVLDAAQAALMEASVARDEAQEVYDALKSESAENTKLIDIATKGHADFDDMIVNTPDAGKAGKKKMLEFSTVLKKIDCDASLIAAAPTALTKPAEEQGMFDKLTIESITSVFKKFLEAKNAFAAEQDTKETTAWEAIESARTVESEADAKVKSAESTLATANSELEQLNTDRSDVETLIEDHDFKVSVAESEKVDALAAEDDFAKVFAAFRELVVRTDIVPEVEEVVEEMEVEEEVVAEEPVEEVVVEEPVVEEAAPVVEEPAAPVVEEVVEEVPVEEEIPEEEVPVPSENKESVNAPVSPAVKPVSPARSKMSASPEKVSPARVQEQQEQNGAWGNQYNAAWGTQYQGSWGYQ